MKLDDQAALRCTVLKRRGEKYALRLTIPNVALKLEMESLRIVE